jgi:DNA replication protein DnaC
MKATSAGDAARIELKLTELRLPAMKPMWSKLASQAKKEGWPAARFLAALTDLEMAERERRRSSNVMGN